MSTTNMIDLDVLADRAPLIGGYLIAVAVLAVGVASFVVGIAPGFELRFPTYVLAGSVVFVGALLTMRYSPRDCRTVLARATLAGILGFALVSLGTEGIVYALIVVAPDLSIYFLSAAVVASGLGYWSVRSWHSVDDLTRPW